MKPGDQVYRWMTPCPLTVQRDAKVGTVRDLMRDNHVRHLPVIDGGDLVGIISERDVKAVERFIDVRRTIVGDVMTAEPYVAAPSAPLAEVADEMARHKYGAAIVVDAGRVVGMFTTVDALRALAEERGHHDVASAAK